MTVNELKKILEEDFEGYEPVYLSNDSNCIYLIAGRGFILREPLEEIIDN